MSFSSLRGLGVTSSRLASRFSMTTSCRGGVRRERTVYGRGRTCPQTQKSSQIPGDTTLLVGRVGAQVARLDAGREVLAQGRVSVPDLPEGVLDALGHREAGPLPRGRRLAVAPAEA